MSFRVGNADARVLARGSAKPSLGQLRYDLDRYEVLVKLMQNGGESGAVPRADRCAD